MKNSAGRPGEVTSGEEVNVQMRDSFPGVFTVIDDESEALAAVTDAEFVGGLFGDTALGEVIVMSLL